MAVDLDGLEDWLGFECPKAIKLIKEIIEYSGNQLSIHKGNGPEAHAQFVKEGRASALIDEHHAHVFLNQMLNEGTLVHELLHVKSAWILQNPCIQPDARLSPSIRGSYHTMSTALDHIYVLREQKKMGFPVPKDFKADHRNNVSKLVTATDVLDIKIVGGLTHVFLKLGLVTDNHALRRLEVFLEAASLGDWVQSFSREMRRNKNSFRNMAIICFQHGLIDNNEAVLLVRDIQAEELIPEQFAEI